MENNAIFVELEYFEPLGGWFGSGTYETKYTPQIQKIWEEVKEVLKSGERPGLIGENDRNFSVLISIPEHERNILHLVPCAMEDGRVVPMNIKEFMLDRVLDLEGTSACEGRKVVDCLICLKFEDGHMHFLFPNNTPMSDFVDGLNREIEKTKMRNVITPAPIEAKKKTEIIEPITSKKSTEKGKKAKTAEKPSKDNDKKEVLKPEIVDDPKN